MRNTLEVCFTPEILPAYEPEGKIVVVVDIFRATSCMTAALASGVAAIIPVESLEACKQLQMQGYKAAAERGGEKVEGFDLDNSPFSYMSESLKGQTIAMTTTNGTKAIALSEKADTILIASFLNIKAVADYLSAQTKDVIVLCAGWQGKANLEDTLFAGALCELLREVFETEQDSSLMANCIYKTARQDMKQYLQKANHYKRLMRLGREKDIDFCLTKNVYDTLPVLKNGQLVAYGA